MPKTGCKTTSVNIENNLYAMSIEEGINLTSFVNRALALFFEVPEDPRDKLIREKTKYSVLRLREKYQKEIVSVIKEYESQSEFDQVSQEKEEELIQFGNFLKKTTAFPMLKNCLSTRNFNEDTLQIVTSEVNKMNGKEYDTYGLWNKAIEWYRKYGQVTG